VLSKHNSTPYASDAQVCLSNTVWSYFRQRTNYSDIDNLYNNVSLSYTNCPATYYNELASLLQISGENTVTQLFTTGSFNMFGIGTLLFFMLIYFFLAVITSSLSIPAGMVVPSLIIGGALGRVVAMIANMTIKVWLGDRFVDPGTWAMVGAAAFWCGSARITVTIAVIIMEITGDFRYIPAIAVAVMFAKLVGALLTDSVYHMTIHLKNIPFLEDIPAKAMDNKFVRDIMVSTEFSSIYHLSKNPSVQEVTDILDERTLRHERKHHHNGFPIIDELRGQLRLVGFISREQLVQARKDQGKISTDNINLEKYMNETPVTVLPSFTVTQAFK
jgi:chloride channel 7